jgi:hypothetical protein
VVVPVAAFSEVEEPDGRNASDVASCGLGAERNALSHCGMNPIAVCEFPSADFAVEERLL